MIAFRVGTSPDRSGEVRLSGSRSTWAPLAFGDWVGLLATENGERVAEVLGVGDGGSGGSTSGD